MPTLDQDSVVRGMRLTAEVHDLPWVMSQVEKAQEALRAFGLRTFRRR